MLTGISLFSGAGGLDIAAKWAGIKTVAYVEFDPYAQGVLMSRMRDGSLDDAPIFEDVRTFRGASLRGSIDVVSAGFPCQPHSQVGKRGGAADERNLWPHTLRTLVDTGAWAFLGENVPGIVTNGYIATVLAELEERGFKAKAYSHSSCAIGAPHSRTRVFILAYSDGFRRSRLDQNKEIVLPREHRQGTWRWRDKPHDLLRSMELYGANPMRGVLRVDDGLAQGLDRLRLCGNGVDPRVAYPFFKNITDNAQAN